MLVDPDEACSKLQQWVGDLLARQPELREEIEVEDYPAVVAQQLDKDEADAAAAAALEELAAQAGMEVPQLHYNPHQDAAAAATAQQQGPALTPVQEAAFFGLSAEEKAAWAAVDAAAAAVSDLEDVGASKRQLAAARRQHEQAKEVVREVTCRLIRERAAAAAAEAPGGE